MISRGPVLKKLCGCEQTEKRFYASEYRNPAEFGLMPDELRSAI